jgi:putative transposase
VFGGLAVNKSGFYNWPNASAGPFAQRDKQGIVLGVYESSCGIYGSAKITEELGHSRELESACRNTVAKAMKEMVLKSRVFKQFKPTTTVADPAQQIAANLLNQEFNATRLNERLVAKITISQHQWAGFIWRLSWT